MKLDLFSGMHYRWVGAAVLTGALIFTAGCKSQPAPRNDQQLTSDVQSKLQGEQALASQNVQVSVVNGVATLSGTVTDEASRALAGNDSGAVNGIKTVVNNLTVQTASQAAAAQTAAAPPAAPEPAPAPKPRASDESRRHREHARQEQANAAPVSAPAPEQVAPPPQQVAEAPAPVQAPPPPPPAPKPVVKMVTLPAGTTIPVRITETLDTKTAQANDVFHGSLASDLGIDGVIAVPRGAEVVGRVADAREAAHFKGAALLSIELTELVARGQRLSLVTDPYTKAAEGRGKNTAEKAGGGAVLGAIIGGIAGGGKGAAIGGLAGAGAGTGINAATRGQQVVIPTETLVNFQLQAPVTIRVTSNGARAEDEQDPSLQQRQP